MSGIDPNRLADCIDDVWAMGWIRMDKETLEIAKALAKLYDARTAEWREKMRSVQISAAATPTRKGRG